MNEDMTSRERVLTALAHKETDRIPFNLGFGINAPALQALYDYLGMTDPASFHAYVNRYRDIANVGLDYHGPSDRHCVTAAGTSVDIWGVERASVSYGIGSYDEISRYPLADIDEICQLDSYRFPTADWFSADNLKDNIKNIRKQKDYAVMVGNGNIFESAWYMRGFEQMLTDLITEPELAWAIMTKVTDYFIAYFTKVLQTAEGMIDIVFTADDIGQQQGLLTSLDLWDKMIKPHHVRLNKLLHEYGVKVMYHTDGAVMEAVPGLIDMGIDVLEALQFDAYGMDAQQLKTLYGDKLCFHGGISVQSTLPFGTADDVKREIHDRITILGANGGYILAPSHAIQAGTPPENTAVFLESPGNYVK